MNLVIVGVGRVGETLVENFIKENHDIVVVDVDIERVNYVVNRYDVQGVNEKVLNEGISIILSEPMVDDVVIEEVK